MLLNVSGRLWNHVRGRNAVGFTRDRFGSGKVLAMDQVMKLPFKVSTTTSNFMIGVTAAASAGVYLSRGYILPGLSMPVMLGVLVGALVGSRILVNADVKLLRLVFSIVIVALGLK